MHLVKHEQTVRSWTGQLSTISVCPNAAANVQRLALAILLVGRYGSNKVLLQYPTVSDFLKAYQRLKKKHVIDVVKHRLEFIGEKPPAASLLLLDVCRSKISQDSCVILNPAGAGPPRHPPAAGGGDIKLPPFTFAKISSQREETEKRNFAHIFLNT